MDINWLLAGGAFTAVVAAWNQIKGFFLELRSLFIITIIIQYDGARAVSSYLADHSKRYAIGLRQFTAINYPVKSLRGELRLIPFELIGTGSLIVYRKAVILLERGKSQVSDAKSEAVDDSNSVVRLTFIRGALDYDQLMKDATDYYFSLKTSNGDNNRRFVRRVVGISDKMANARYNGSEILEKAVVPSSGSDESGWVLYSGNRIIGYDKKDIGFISPYFGINELALSYEAMMAVDEIDRWAKSKDWYQGHGIPWKRGLLLYGQAGCGKTALCRSLSDELNMPIYLYDLSSLSNDELQREWKNMMSSAPCIAVMEDIDTVFDGRKTISGQMTFDCLLNCIDGVERSDGVLLIVTTNHIDKIDDALAGAGQATRPGRVDRVLEMGKPDADGREKIARRILSDYPELISEVIMAGDGDTGAQFQERCTEVALEKFWDR